MLVVGQVLHDLLNVDWRLLLVSVSLAREAGHVDEDRGISGDTRDGADDVFVQFVELTTLVRRDEH